MNNKGYPDNWDQIAFEKKKEAGFRCPVCNADAIADPSVQLNVHHIDYNPANNEDTNLVVLCQLCHLALHRLEYWERKHQADYFKALSLGQLPFNLPPEFKPQPLDSKLTLLKQLAQSRKYPSLTT